MAAEDPVQAAQHRRILRIVAEHVRYQHPARAQNAPAIGIKARAAERWRQAGSGKTVHQQHVDPRARAGNAGNVGKVRGRVRPHHGEAGVIWRHAKLFAQCDHVGAQFEHGDAGARKAPVAKLGKRASAQPDHQNVARVRHEQREAHHRARIVQQQRARARQPHRALHLAGQKFERAHVAAGAHQRRCGCQGWALARWGKLARHVASVRAAWRTRNPCCRSPLSDKLPASHTE